MLLWLLPMVQLQLLEIPVRSRTHLAPISSITLKVIPAPILVTQISASCSSCLPFHSHQSHLPMLRLILRSTIHPLLRVRQWNLLSRTSQSIVSLPSRDQFIAISFKMVFMVQMIQRLAVPLYFLIPMEMASMMPVT